jgi:hypothetical protein
LPITEGSTRSAARQRAGGPPVTRFIHSRWIGSKGAGRPRRMQIVIKSNSADLQAHQIILSYRITKTYQSHIETEIDSSPRLYSSARRTTPRARRRSSRLRCARTCIAWRSKSVEHQTRAVAFRTRQYFVGQCTQLINALRGHLAEFGLVVAKGPANLKSLGSMMDNASLDVPEGVRDGDLPALS